MPSRRIMFSLISAAGAGLCAMPGEIWAGPTASRAGVVDFASGDATLVDAQGRKRAESGAVVYAGQTVQAGRDSEVHIVLDDGGHLAVRQMSAVRITQARILGDADDMLAMTLLRGAMRSITGWVGKFEKSSYQLRAGTATIGIRGTDHEVALVAANAPGADGNPGVHSWVNEGGTTLRTPNGAIDVEPQQAAWAGADGSAPRRHAGIPPFLQRWRTANEGRINEYGYQVRQHIESRLRQRGLWRDGDSLEDVMRRHPKAREHIKQKLQERRAEQRERHPRQNHGEGRNRQD